MVVAFLHLDIIINLILQQLFIWTAGFFKMDYAISPVKEWHRHVASIISGQGIASSSLTLVAVISAIGFGTVLITRERLGAFQAYIATPVTRLQIALAKYVIGLGTVLGAVTLYYVITIILGSITDANWSFVVLTRWFILLQCVLTCIFSTCFLASSFTGHLLSSFSFAFILIYAPFYISNWMELMFPKVIELRQLFDYMFLLFYFGKDINSLDTLSLLRICLVLICFSVIAFKTSVKIFERNQMEKNGKMFVINGGTEFIRVVLSVFLALQLTGMIFHGSKLHVGMIALFDLIVMVFIWVIFPLIVSLFNSGGNRM
jgi:hypothetical protein